MVGGGAVAQIAGDATAITPAWRRSILHLSAVTVFNATDNAAGYLDAQKTVHSQIEPFRQLAPLPQGGQYLNEVRASKFWFTHEPCSDGVVQGDVIEKNWQQALWGSNYDRLLKIKKEIDPKDLLIVYYGVNSEDWDAEVVCKTVEATD
jgi:hypothetical protein